MKTARSLFLNFLFFASLVLFISLGKNHLQANAATAHVVISEVQVSGDGATPANDEFVELYNPTSSTVSLANWKLTKKTPGGTESNLISTMSGNISSHGYFLIARSEYNGSVTPDATYSSALIASDNTVLLYDNTATIVDKVGFGTATDKEITTVANPAANHSVERKANSTSTLASMTTGADQFAGNGEDTDNNATDFIIRTVSDPQNSQSAIEPVAVTPTDTPSPTQSPTPTVTPTSTPSLTPTPTDTPTPNPTATPIPTDTPTPTPTATPTPTIIPTDTPIPTPSPTPTNIPSETPTPTVLPSVTPTEEPSPTLTPTPTVLITPTITLAPTVTPTATPTPTPEHNHHERHFVFEIRHKRFHMHHFDFSLPYIHCGMEETKNHDGRRH
jgi:hypothetical protein